MAGVFVAHQVPVRAARELLLTGVLIDAARAKEIGLLNRVVPAAELQDAAQDLAAAILRGAPGAVAASKRWLNQLSPPALGSAFDAALELHRRGRESAEATEGIAAFREKRRPGWDRSP